MRDDELAGAADGADDDGKIRDITQAGPILGMVSVALDAVDWDHLLRGIESAHVVGSLLDPTAYRDALYDGSLAENERVIRATREYVATLREVHEAALARRARVAENGRHRDHLHVDWASRG